MTKIDTSDIPERGSEFFKRAKLSFGGVPLHAPAPRPKCILCGKGYGRRKIEQHGLVAEKDFVPKVPQPGKTPMHVIKIEHLPYGHRDGKDMIMHRWTFWDGRSFTWTHTQPFCSYVCALAYARRAVNAGF